jgi:hypothetical protein
MLSINYYEFEETKDGWRCSGYYGDNKNITTTFRSIIKQVYCNEIKEVSEANVYVYSDSDTIYNIQTTLDLPLNPSDLVAVNYNNINMPSVIYMAMMGSILIRL